MVKLAWMTDPHLNFLDVDSRKEFCRSLNKLKVDALLLGGDIGEAVGIESYLKMLNEVIDLPIYFVLGNHDYYRGSIAEVRSRVRQLCAGSKKLTWLPEAGVIQISPEACLIGHDSWADGRFGNFLESKVMLNDYRLIEDLIGLSSEERLNKLHALGDEVRCPVNSGHSHLKRQLPGLCSFERILQVTHYQGESDAVGGYRRFRCTL